MPASLTFPSLAALCRYICPRLSRAFTFSTMPKHQLPHGIVTLVRGHIQRRHKVSGN